MGHLFHAPVYRITHLYSEIIYLFVNQQNVCIQYNVDVLLETVLFMSNLLYHR